MLPRGRQRPIPLNPIFPYRTSAIRVPPATTVMFLEMVMAIVTVAEVATVTEEQFEMRAGIVGPIAVVGNVAIV